MSAVSEHKMSGEKKKKLNRLLKNKPRLIIMESSLGCIQQWKNVLRKGRSTTSHTAEPLVSLIFFLCLVCKHLSWAGKVLSLIAGRHLF